MKTSKYIKPPFKKWVATEHGLVLNTETGKINFDEEEQAYVICAPVKLYQGNKFAGIVECEDLIVATADEREELL